MEKFEESKEVAETSMHNLLETDVSVGAQSWGFHVPGVASPKGGTNYTRISTPVLPSVVLLWENLDLSDLTGLALAPDPALGQSRACGWHQTGSSRGGGGLSLGGNTAGKDLGRIWEGFPSWQTQSGRKCALCRTVPAGSALCCVEPRTSPGLPAAADPQRSPTGSAGGSGWERALIAAPWFPRSSR